MGLRKSAGSRVYDTVDMSFSATTGAMAARLRHLAEVRQASVSRNRVWSNSAASMVGDSVAEDAGINALTGIMAEGMRIKFEEEVEESVELETIVEVQTSHFNGEEELQSQITVAPIRSTTISRPTSMDFGAVEAGVWNSDKNTHHQVSSPRATFDIPTRSWENDSRDDYTGPCPDVICLVCQQIGISHRSVRRSSNVFTATLAVSSMMAQTSQLSTQQI